jgi:hypothetical protein
MASLTSYPYVVEAAASRARKGEFVKCFDHFELLQTTIKGAESF